MNDEQTLNALYFLGIKLINVEDFTELLIRLVFNSLVIYIVAHFFYNKTSKRKDFYFTYLAVGMVVFLLCFLFNSVKLELGFALGLFAVFGIIRYRTDTIPIKEMTYLFVIIGISVINALSNQKISFAEILLTNAAIILGLWWLESSLLRQREMMMSLVYEKIEHIHLDKKSVLLEDLKTRTGLNVIRYEVHEIDFLRDVAKITVYYKSE